MLTSHIRTVFSAAFTLAFLSTATANPLFPRVVAAFNTTASPPIFDHLFTAQLTLGKGLNVTIPSGFRAVEPIENGTIIGPGLNATITGGSAHNIVIYDETVEIPEINVFGTTDDGEPFFVTQTGIGHPGHQISRFEIDIGGKYAPFATSFIVGVITLSSNNVTVTVEAWNTTAST
ncbi:hypothetical protein PILCRDRAFT_6883 [Piloderma croceum F 1598]|uniref:Uncharacterized protein n=1 Tax=Piloderma croceum (strain F 1598) TaxID=765440 RepID=A0A0C3C384_PILCF|nr:hypothetical protein PILCRDRAFT_6883 [Piloderma croceum F 1598]